MPRDRDRRFGAAAGLGIRGCRPNRASEFEELIRRRANPWQPSKCSAKVVPSLLSVFSSLLIFRTLGCELLLAKYVMVMLRGSMCLITDVLQQSERRRLPAQAQRFRVAGTVNLFFAFGQ